MAALAGRGATGIGVGSLDTARQLLVAREGYLQGSSNGDARWLALAGPDATWKALLASAGPSCTELLPRQCACPRGLRRQLVHLARIARRDGDAPITLPPCRQCAR
jgi:hypothetical protein